MESTSMTDAAAVVVESRRPKGKEKKRNRLRENESIEEARALWTQCVHFMETKRRFCNIGRAPGSNYCGNHTPVAEEVSSARKLAEAARYGVDKDSVRRVPCPLDPNHTVYEFELEKHLKICNVKRMQQELAGRGYYCQDCNTPANKPTLHGQDEVNPEELLAKIKACYHSTVSPELTEGPSELEETVKAAVMEAVAGESTAFSKVRHGLQDALLAQKMVTSGVLSAEERNRLVIVELGAGILCDIVNILIILNI